jgi:hypothetical protein
VGVHSPEFPMHQRSVNLEMSFWYLHFFNKKKEKNWPNYYGTSSQTVFICFLERIEDMKNIFLKSTDRYVEISVYLGWNDKWLAL